MSQLESVFEVRSGDNAPGDGIFEGGMFSSHELAKTHADEVIKNLSNFEDLQWVSVSRAEGRFYWVQIEEHVIIYPEQE
jgi:hypothetical protein